MLKIRWSRDRLIFNMGIAIPGIDGLYIEAGPRSAVAERPSDCHKANTHYDYGNIYMLAGEMTSTMKTAGSANHVIVIIIMVSEKCMKNNDDIMVGIEPQHQL